MGEPIIIENNARFSESILWHLQREYFDQQGVKAWDNQVPYFVTSNTFIANSYANITVSFFRDYLKLNPHTADHPFYIIELGTGTGQFSFYMVKRLRDICHTLQLTNLSFRYIMTDFTESNLHFWQSHPMLKEFVNEGLLDFAIYNMEEDEEINLIVKKEPLSKKNIKNPLIVFANYIFDTVSHDCFNIANKKLQEVRVSITTPPENYHDKRIVDMKNLQIQFSESEISDNYYADPILNKLLENYENKITKSTFLIPSSGLKSISKLRQLSNDNLLLLSSDKGYTTIPQLEQLGYPHVSFHGSFSMMVNFHAISEYFRHIGGEHFFQSPRKGIKTCLFFKSKEGFTLANLGATRHASEVYIEGFSPADYFLIHRYISETFRNASLDKLASHLVLAAYDPYIYHRLNSHICEIINQSDAQTIAHLLQSIHKIANNFYYMPNANDTFFDIACVFHRLQKFHKAIEFYKKSKKLFGNNINCLYNLAVCQYQIGKAKEALKNFQLAKECNGQSENSRYIQEWIDNLSRVR